jgi:twitching motility protein PilT
MRILELLKQMREQKASDLFLATGKAPRLRIAGSLRALPGPELEFRDFETFLHKNFPPGTLERLQAERDLDLGLSTDSTTRFRLNLSYQRNSLAMAVRQVPSGALDFDQLLMPPVLKTLIESPRGLILITGATGSGKSTTMASMLHHLNTHFSRHIVTVEDPIEFVHEDAQCLISQREVGTDTLSFATALKHVVRQNPDVIFVGEIRDLESIRMVISAAMTGHLVVSTMHTVDVVQTLERIINYFPDHLRDQIAIDLSLALVGIVSQRLLPHCDGEGVVPAFEILRATPLVRRVVAERRLDEIEDIIKTSGDDGMQTFTRSLVQRCQENRVTPEAAAAVATNRDEFLLAIQGMETGIETLRSLGDHAAAAPLTNMKSLLRAAIRNGASDLHLTVGRPPLLRLDGQLLEVEMPPLTASDTRRLLFSVLSPRQRTLFEAEKEIDFALSISTAKEEGDGELSRNRFRVNGFYEKGSVAAAFRIIAQKIPDAKTLGIPPVVMELAQRQQGLVLVTGPTGHGKSTTLACLIDVINRSRACHIITVEDPIEFVHTSQKAVIQQREVHADTKGFNNALKYVLRQDPDVILIGEMRDPETIGAALTAAETGHLVFATLHTNDAAQTVDRIVDSFPAHRQNQVRTQLASCLDAVVAQRLLPRLDGEGRVAVFEVLLGSMAVRALIRDNRTHQIASAMETSAKDGMVTMERALKDLYDRRLIDRQMLNSLSRDNRRGV